MIAATVGAHEPAPITARTFSDPQRSVAYVDRCSPNRRPAPDLGRGDPDPRGRAGQGSLAHRSTVPNAATSYGRRWAEAGAGRCSRGLFLPIGWGPRTECASGTTRLGTRRARRSGLVDGAATIGQRPPQQRAGAARDRRQLISRDSARSRSPHRDASRTSSPGPCHATTAPVLSVPVFER